jgi:hypothetical protein
MAGTRTKQTKGDFFADANQMARQSEWLMNTAPCVNDKPSYPSDYAVPRMPASLLSRNAIDIETMLRGIGANNYVYERPAVAPQLHQLPSVCFYNRPDIFVPKLPPYLQKQRPL